jgi:predicted DsbA family dithiol-disulfide isomerase
VQWRAFPLHPETPEEGRTLEDLFAGRPVSVAEIKARLRKAAEDAGLPLGDRQKTYNSRLAQELGKWAEEKGRGEEFHTAVFRAYFVDGVNIAKIEELAAIAKKTGLPAEEARIVLEKRTQKAAVDSDWKKSRRLGITAVPTFVVNQRGIVGAQPYEVLEQFLEENQIKRKDEKSEFKK